MTLVDPRDLAAIEIGERARRLGWTQLRPVGEDRNQIALDGILELGLKPRDGAKRGAPLQPELRVRQDVEHIHWIEPLGQYGFKFLQPTGSSFLRWLV